MIVYPICYIIDVICEDWSYIYFLFLSSQYSLFQWVLHCRPLGTQKINILFLLLMCKLVQINKYGQGKSNSQTLSLPSFNLLTSMCIEIELLEKKVIHCSLPYIFHVNIKSLNSIVQFICNDDESWRHEDRIDYFKKFVTFSISHFQLITAGTRREEIRRKSP